MWNDVELSDDAPDSGCSWPVIYTCDQSDDADVAEWAEQMAIEIVWAASGRQFGLCTKTYRPCVIGCEPQPMINEWRLIGVKGAFAGVGAWDSNLGWDLSIMGCGCRDSCSCTRLEQFELSPKPVRQVHEVTIDGAVLDESAYRLSKNRLIRVDGEAWPLCQDWTVNADQPGAWTVKMTYGRPVPFGGRVAAGVLAGELTKAVCGDDTCELPRRVQTITKAGVTVGFVDPMQFLNEGKTGLYEVDLWLVSVNPNRLARRARVYRVDDPRRLAKGRVR
jgi:hypothetical protein